MTTGRPKSVRVCRFIRAHVTRSPPATRRVAIPASHHLRAAVGETVYLVELVESAIQLAAHISATPHVLLGVIDFPRPDPAKGLTPHLVLLDDGRGVNLGRIVRISRCPFAPAPDDLLYLDRAANENLLFAERRLSREFLAQRTRVVLGACLGYRSPELERLPGGPGDTAVP